MRKLERRERDERADFGALAFDADFVLLAGGRFGDVVVELRTSLRAERLHEADTRRDAAIEEITRTVEPVTQGGGVFLPARAGYPKKNALWKGKSTTLTFKVVYNRVGDHALVPHHYLGF